MDWKRCEKHHMYPSDKYAECLFCSGLIDDNDSKSAVAEIFAKEEKLSLKKPVNNELLMQQPNVVKKPKKEQKYTFFYNPFWDYLPRIFIIILVLVLYIPSTMIFGFNFWTTLICGTGFLLAIFAK